MSRVRRIYSPRSAVVEVDDRGAPHTLGGTSVESIREEWVVEDRWWTDHSLRRHYYELILVDGQNVTVFHDLRTGRWCRQQA